MDATLEITNIVITALLIGELGFKKIVQIVGTMYVPKQVSGTFGERSTLTRVTVRSIKMKKIPSMADAQSVRTRVFFAN